MKHGAFNAVQYFSEDFENCDNSKTIFLSLVSHQLQTRG